MTLAIATATAARFKLPWLDLGTYDINQCPIGLVDSALISRYQALPLFRRRRTLYLAVSNPGEISALDDIKFNTGLTLELVVVEDDKLASAVKQLVGRQESDALGLACLQEDNVNPDQFDILPDQDSDGVKGDEAPIVSLINKVLGDAIQCGASDIHFEPYETNYRIRFRIDGLLQEVMRLPVKISRRIASRLKILSQMDISEKRKAQDGRTKFRTADDRTVNFRVSNLPTLWGEKVVLRIMDRSSAPMGIASLGMDERQKLIYLEAIKRKQGMILITGPTGSGKTVSLYTGLAILNTAELNISTAEDPVEINLDGINQVSIKHHGGMDFAGALRALLRQDPDVVMVGEIRDRETAEVAVKAAQTGHLVMSTLHTNNAAESLTRLRNLGVPTYNLATSVSLIIAQRLLRLLCNKCKEKVKISEKLLLGEGFTKSQVSGGKFFRPTGCKHCRDGYRGRTGIYEVVPITEALSQLIMAQDSSIALAEAVRRGEFLSLRQSALIKVARGLTSLEEATRVT